MKVGNAYILYPPISLSTVLSKKAQFTYIIIPFLYELYLVSSRHQVHLHEHKSPDLRHPIGNSQRGNNWKIIMINTTKKKNRTVLSCYRYEPNNYVIGDKYHQSVKYLAVLPCRSHVLSTWPVLAETLH